MHVNLQRGRESLSAIPSAPYYETQPLSEEALRLVVDLGSRSDAFSGTSQTHHAGDRLITHRSAARYVPAIITFVGYNPDPIPKTLGEPSIAKRRALGFSLERAALPGQDARINALCTRYGIGNTAGKSCEE